MLHLPSSCISPPLTLYLFFPKNFCNSLWSWGSPPPHFVPHLILYLLYLTPYHETFVPLNLDLPYSLSTTFLISHPVPRISSSCTSIPLIMYCTIPPSYLYLSSPLFALSYRSVCVPLILLFLLLSSPSSCISPPLPSSPLILYISLSASLPLRRSFFLSLFCPCIPFPFPYKLLPLLAFSFFISPSPFWAFSILLFKWTVSWDWYLHELNTA